MLEERKKEILDKNYYLNKRHDTRKKNQFLRIKHRSFLVAIFLSIVLIGLVYFLGPWSNVYSISVKGNKYYTNEDILKKSNLSTNDKFLLAPISKAKKLLLNDPLIKSANVTRNDNKLITIEVEENKIYGYAYEDYESVLLLDDNQRIVLDNDNNYLITKVPLVSGFTKEQLELVAKGFENVDASIINEISEIHRYPFSYDQNMLEVIMRDGNYVFVSSFGLKLLDNYYSISSGLQLDKSGACIYLDEVTNSGYTSRCPWQEEIEPTPVEEIDIEIDEKDNEIDVEE